MPKQREPFAILQLARTPVGRRRKGISRLHDLASSRTPPCVTAEEFRKAVSVDEYLVHLLCLQDNFPRLADEDRQALLSYLDAERYTVVPVVWSDGTPTRLVILEKDVCDSASTTSNERFAVPSRSQPEDGSN